MGASLGCMKPASTSLHAQHPIEARPEDTSEALRTLDEVFAKELATDPIRQHYQGIKDNQDQWTLRTPEYKQARLDAANAALKEMKTRFPLDALNPQGRLNYLLYEDKVTRLNQGVPWQHHGYGITQMRGTHSWIPSFLINVHRVSEERDARAYIQRLMGVGAVIDIAIQELEDSHERGILPPAFVFPMVIDDCQNLLKGAPFEDTAPGPWLQDITEKIEALEDLTDDQKSALILEAAQAITQHVGPAYTKLLETLTRLQQHATREDGVWKLPDGAAYYAHRLKRTTTTSMTADEIHQLGLDEVARIHSEMQDIQAQVGFEGSFRTF